jgi:hypothetical protein
MKVQCLAGMMAVVALSSGCMTHTPRVLPPDHGLTAQSALALVQPAMERAASNGIKPKATLSTFQYWDWNSKMLMGSYGNRTTYLVPLRTARYTDITNVVVNNFIWISPGNPYLMSNVTLSLANGNRLDQMQQETFGDVLNMLPPFWFFDPKRRVRKANALADAFLLLRDVQQKAGTNSVVRTGASGGRDAFESALQKAVSSGKISSDQITITYPDGSQKTISGQTK